MKQLVEFSLEDGSKVLVEVEEPVKGGAQRVALKPGKLAVEAKKTFEAALETVRPTLTPLVNKLRELPAPPQEMEIKFGLKMSAQAGAVIAACGGEANFEISMKWMQR